MEDGPPSRTSPAAKQASAIGGGREGRRSHRLVSFMRYAPWPWPGVPGGAASTASWPQSASGAHRIQGKGSPCPGRGTGPVAGRAASLSRRDRRPQKPCPSPPSRRRRRRPGSSPAGDEPPCPARAVAGRGNRGWPGAGPKAGKDRQAPPGGGTSTAGIAAPQARPRTGRARSLLRSAPWRSTTSVNTAGGDCFSSAAMPALPARQAAIAPERSRA